MKKLFCVLYFILLVIACSKQKPEMQEISFINEVIKEARAANKLLIIEFLTPECNPCVSLTRDIFDNENYREFLDNNFLRVRVSPSDPVYNSLWNRYKLDYQNTVIYMDKNGNEIDRTVSYDGNSGSYINFMREVSEGKHLYSVVFSTYKKDTLDVYSNYILATKLLFRNKITEAINQYNKVLLLDPDNKSGFNDECRARIDESELKLGR